MDYDIMSFPIIIYYITITIYAFNMYKMSVRQIRYIHTRYDIIIMMLVKNWLHYDICFDPV